MRIPSSVWALALATLTSSAALGDIVTFRFDGTVDTNSISQGEWRFAHPGDSFAFQYSFDAAAIDGDSGVEDGVFDNSISTYTLFAGAGFESGTGGSISVSNRVSDLYHVQIGLAGDFVADIMLRDNGGTAIGDDAMPTTINLSDWGVRQFNISFAGGGPPVGFLDGTITSFTLVPAPATAAILGAGLLGTTRRRR